MAVATFVGGPVNGQTITAKKWSLYRGDDGQPISARDGDAEWCRRRKRGLGEARQYYVLQRVNGLITYVHATAWR